MLCFDHDVVHLLFSHLFCMRCFGFFGFCACDVVTHSSCASDVVYAVRAILRPWRVAVIVFSRGFVSVVRSVLHVVL